MTARGQWDPLRELMSVQKRMNKLFESAMGFNDFETHEDVDSWSPVCDVFETPEELVLLLELPGLAQDGIELRMDGDDLIVAGERELLREQPEEQFHRVERSYGKFSRRFHLPSSVDRDAVEASYRHGMLRVTLPHRADKQTGSIRVAIQ